jgi:hypothetical protein
MSLPPSSAPVFEATTNGDALLQLRLFHHYTTMIAYTLPGATNKKMAEAWASDTPALALQCRYLLNAVLGLSAWHLARSGDSSMLAPAQGFLSASAAAHRGALSHIDASNAEPILMTSSLLLISTRRSDKNLNPEPYEPPILSLNVLRGLRTVYRYVQCWVAEANIRANFDHGKTLLSL